jgi:glycosyltransferase involved in cell wall biosynthesis
MTLRVAHLITQLELGGAQRNTLYTLDHLDKQRFEPWLITGLGGQLDGEVKMGGVPAHFVSCLQRDVHPLLDLIALVQLYKLLRRLRPHVVHTHSSKAGILGRVAAYLAGVPVIVHTYHGFGFTPSQSEFVRKNYVRLERACAFLTQHLVFVSEDNRQEAARERISGRATASLIRSGIAVQSFAATEVRASLGIPDHAWIAISVGNFKPQKNPMDLLKVACEATSQDPDIHFLLLGDGELRPQAEQYAQSQGRAERIHFLGWRKDARSLLAASNCFVLTSLWEGLPRALVEAFAEGLPAVAYAVNGVKDILIEGQNGFPVETGNTAKVVEKLLWLKAHPGEAQHLGAAGRARIQEEFDIDRMVRSQESLYESLWQAVPLKEYYDPNITAPATPPSPDAL